MTILNKFVAPKVTLIVLLSMEAMDDTPPSTFDFDEVSRNLLRALRFMTALIGPVPRLKGIISSPFPVGFLSKHPKEVETTPNAPQVPKVGRALD